MYLKATRNISWHIWALHIAVLSMNTDQKNPRKIIAIYVATSTVEHKDVEKFYKEVGKTIQIKLTYTLLLGVFNAEESIEEAQWNNVGKYGSERGQWIIKYTEVLSPYVTFFFLSQQMLVEYLLWLHERYLDGTQREQDKVPAHNPIANTFSRKIRSHQTALPPPPHIQKKVGNNQWWRGCRKTGTIRHCCRKTILESNLKLCK